MPIHEFQNIRLLPQGLETSSPPSNVTSPPSVETRKPEVTSEKTPQAEGVPQENRNKNDKAPIIGFGGTLRVGPLWTKSAGSSNASLTGFLYYPNPCSHDFEDVDNMLAAAIAVGGEGIFGGTARQGGGVTLGAHLAQIKSYVFTARNLGMSLQAKAGGGMMNLQEDGKLWKGHYAYLGGELVLGARIFPLGVYLKFGLQHEWRPVPTTPDGSKTLQPTASNPGFIGFGYEVGIP